MKAHHKFCHAFDTTRTYNRVVNSIDYGLAFLKNEDIGGYPLNEPLETLQGMIVDTCKGVLSKYANIATFLNAYDYDLSQYTNRSKLVVLQDKIKADFFADNLQVAIVAPQINTTDKLSQIVVANELTHATPLTLETPYHYSIMLNDWLDASAYTLKGINQANGELLIKTDEEKRLMVKGYLGQFPNLLGITYPVELQPEIDLMVSIRDQVLSILDTTDVLEVAKLINDNIERVPLMRRIWDIA